MALPHGGGGTGDEQVYNPSVEALTLWDISSRPTTNDSLMKLGRGMTAIAQAVYAKDGDWPVQFTDFALRSVPSRRSFDPDHWVLRIHDAGGRGPNTHWVPRGVCDHTNPHYERTHRGTMVIDAAVTQLYANRADLEWIAELGTANTHAELAFNGAGFLDMLYNGTGGVGTRGALAANMAKNAGYITDGVYVGQLGHVLRLLKAAGGGNTVAGGARPSSKVNLGLRGDVLFDYDGYLGIWWPTSKEKLPEKKKDGTNYLVEFAPSAVMEPQGQDPTLDPVSNHEPIARNPGRLIMGIVKLPDSMPTGSDIKYDGSWHAKPPSKKGSGSGGGAGAYPDVATQHGEGERPPIATGGMTDGGTPTPSTPNPGGAAVDTSVDTSQDVPVTNDSLYYWNGDSYAPREYVDVGPSSSVQVQYGESPAGSPAFTQRFNVFPHAESGRELSHPTMAWNFSKPVGYANIAMEVMLKVSDPIPAGESVTMDLKILAYDDDKPPANTKTIYGRQIILDSTTPSGPDGAWKRVVCYFTGFDDTQDLVVKTWLERRSDNGYLDATKDSNVEVWVLRVQNTYD